MVSALSLLGFALLLRVSDAGVAPVETVGLPGLYYHCMLFFNSSMYVIGGVNASFQSSAGTYVSTRLPYNSYTLLGSNPGWGVRSSMACAVDRNTNSMILTGGFNLRFSASNKDVWRSRNGFQWTLATGAAPWTNRSGHGLVYSDFQKALFLFGGLTIPSFLHWNDVWRSTDGGVSWTQILPLRTGLSNMWAPRAYFGYTYWGGRIWVSNGYDHRNTVAGTYLVYPCVWSSVDGANWIQSGLSGTPSPRLGTSLVGVAGLGIFSVSGALAYNAVSNSGVGGGDINDYHYSLDGSNWCIPTQTPAPFRDAFRSTGMIGFASASNGTSAFVTGGYSTSFTTFGANVYVFEAPFTCQNGAYQWRLSQKPPPWTPRCGQSLTGMNGVLYAIGGSTTCTGAGARNEIFVSRDSGLNWSLSESLSAGIPAMYYHRAVFVATQNRTYILGGINSTDAGLRSIYSTDGNTVTLVGAALLPTGARSQFAVTTDGTTIFLFCGFGTSSSSVSAFSSVSPFTTWIMRTTAVGQGAHPISTLIWQGQIWYIGGQRSSTWFSEVKTRTPTLYLTAGTGAAWPTLSASGAQISPRSDYCLAALDENTLYIAGGRNGWATSLPTSSVTKSGTLWSASDIIPVPCRASSTLGTFQTGLYSMACETIGTPGSAKKNLILYGGISDVPASPTQVFSNISLVYAPNNCLSWPCLNSGTCVSVLQNYTCECLKGFTGTHCETNIDECASAPCGPGGVCVDQINGYECACLAGFIGSVCQTNIDECASRPCRNGATCIDGANAFACACTPGYSGVLCHMDIDECASSPCGDGGVCTDLVNGYSCSCLPGYSGPVCQTDIDECASVLCENSGTCVDGVNSFGCLCPPGFEGSLCQTETNECASRPCANGGTCTDLVNRYACSCTPGFTGEQCQTEANECGSRPCTNGGTCVDQVNGYSCLCVAGFSGAQCQTEVNECASQPCVNSGTCTDLANGYSCACAPGYSGVRCQTEVNECASQPCANSGTCLDQLNGYTCVCPLGATGARCQTDVNECSSGPCSNGGTCLDGIASFACLCPIGYEGVLCETNRDECASGPCMNGGTCVDESNRYTCLCLPGYGGSECQIASADSSTAGGIQSTEKSSTASTEEVSSSASSMGSTHSSTAHTERGGLPGSADETSSSSISSAALSSSGAVSGTLSPASSSSGLQTDPTSENRTRADVIVETTMSAVAVIGAAFAVASNVALFYLAGIRDMAVVTIFPQSF
jgi:hypothetical protein